MPRPRKFYVVYGEARPSYVVRGLAALKRHTGRRYGDGFRTQLEAETTAAWRDYRYGYPHSVNRPRQ